MIRTRRYDALETWGLHVDLGRAGAAAEHTADCGRLRPLMEFPESTLLGSVTSNRAEHLSFILFATFEVKTNNHISSHAASLQRRKACCLDTCILRILGVDRKATQEEIKKAYKKEATVPGAR